MYNKIKHCFLSGWMIRGKLNISRQSFWEMKTAKIISTIIWKCGPMDIVLDGSVAVQARSYKALCFMRGLTEENYSRKDQRGIFLREVDPYRSMIPKEELPEVQTELADVLPRPHSVTAERLWTLQEVCEGGTIVAPRKEPKVSVGNRRAQNGPQCLIRQVGRRYKMHSFL